MKTETIRRTFNEELTRLSDRGQDIRATLNRLLTAWSFDLDSRKPGIAYIDADGSPVVNLDLACLLSALAEHRAVINLPKYKCRRVATVTEGEHVVSSDNRHGRVMGLSSNQAAFSFSLLVDDVNVVKADGTIGAPRNFMLQDVTGHWHEGWESIELLTSGLKSEVFDKLSAISQTIKFKHFIHPNRWPSFFGSPHLLALAADIRLKDEIKHLKTIRKLMRDALNVEPPVYGKKTVVGSSKKESVWCIEVVLDEFKLSGAYDITKDDVATATKDDLTQLDQKIKRLSSQQKSLRFQVRATHFAFFQNALIPNIPEADLLNWFTHTSATVQPRQPSWIKTRGLQWETGWKEGPKKRVHWAIMRNVKKDSELALRFRCRKKTETVAAD